MMGKRVGRGRYLGGGRVCPRIGGCSSSQQLHPHGWAGDAPGAWGMLHGLGVPWDSLYLGELGGKVGSAEMSPRCPVLLCRVMEEERDAGRKAGG